MIKCASSHSIQFYDLFKMQFLSKYIGKKWWLDKQLLRIAFLKVFALFGIAYLQKCIVICESRYVNSYPDLTLFTGIQYIKFTAVGERAVHITITKNMS
jgi:uncharacterized membrane protein